MKNQEKFDIVVIGSGPGGYPAAIRASHHGKKVALIEKSEIGGTCLNRGCIPSKALIAAAETLSTVQKAEAFGIQVKDIAFDFGKFIDRAENIVTSMRKSLTNLILASGTTIIRGEAKFVGPKTLEVKGENALSIEADKIIIAAGSEPRSIKAFPFDGEKVLSSTDILKLKKLPKTMAIVGGGVIGCEFASLFSKLGVKVILIEMLEQILPQECVSLSKHLSKAFVKKGIEIQTGVSVEGIRKEGDGVIVTLSSKKTFTADLALVAVGRSMNLQSLALDVPGIRLNSPIEVFVDERMETNVKGIYAIGDIASKWWLAHVATHQGLVAADNASGINATMHYNAIPNVIFTDPEIASCGLSEKEAKAKGLDVKVVEFPYKALGKAEALGKTDGFFRLVVNPSTGEILGGQVAGNEASILIAEVALMIQNELTFESVAETIHAHPTLSEGWMECAFLAMNTPLHLPKGRN